jgi:hypothetical protein
MGRTNAELGDLHGIDRAGAAEPATQSRSGRRRSTRQSPRWVHGYGPDRTHAVNGLNDPQRGACSGPEAPAHAPCPAGSDADLCHSEICQASNGEENAMRAVTVTEYGATPAVAEMPSLEQGPGQVDNRAAASWRGASPGVQSTISPARTTVRRPDQSASG